MKSQTHESTLAEVLSDLETIGLDELTATADLQTRKDRKYLVPETAVPALVSALASNLRVLTIGACQRFAYQSTYFDTPALDAYHGAARRRPSRFKVRTRHYLDTHLCMLEVKTRDRRGQTVKHRLGCDPTEEYGLTAEAKAFVGTIGQTSTLVNDLQPLLTTNYERITLTLDLDNAARITIDTGVLWRKIKDICNGTAALCNGAETMCNATETDLRLGPMALIETKTSTRPCAFDHLLWRSGHRPTTFSKYCTGLAAITPTLSANKWNRVLRHQLNWHPDRRNTQDATLLTASRRPKHFKNSSGRRNTQVPTLLAAVKGHQ